MPNDPIIWKQLFPNQRNVLIAEHVFKRTIIKWKKGRGKRQEWVEEQLSYPIQRRGKPKVYSDGRYTYIYGLQWEEGQ